MLKDYEFDDNDYKYDELQNDGEVILKAGLKSLIQSVGCMG